MRILLTNDDGIFAEGLALLREIALQLSQDIWVVAPETEQSGAAHSLTLRHPVRLRSIDARTYAVGGTPTDCVLIGVQELLRDHPPDLILSGVNRGSNMGEDISYSGTVAATMEGTMLDIPSIALSQQRRHESVTWEVARRYGPGLLHHLLQEKMPYNTLININFPYSDTGKVAGIRVVPQGRRILRDHITSIFDPEGQPCFWIGHPRREHAQSHETDLWAVHHSYISITPVHLDLTNHQAIPALQTLCTTYPCNEM